ISLILSSKKYANINIKYVLTFFIAFCVALLLAIQPDVGQTILIFCVWSILIFVSGINIFFLFLLFLSLTLSFSYLIFFVN
ncbi:FtsW/RodA/SpoVE family cell cycle protein, partial [Escherichia coli]|uniref:FtsW/RodA/SpoVE family cell cycle protein n=1 Tax=Escherichia coli TaxID=562 RepID=UPI0014131CEE|nr:FtsW/RodA/SpoVE family cell cycle protein [Escherichia coli]